MTWNTCTRLFRLYINTGRIIRPASRTTNCKIFINNFHLRCCWNTIRSQPGSSAYILSIYTEAVVSSSITMKLRQLKKVYNKGSPIFLRQILKCFPTLNNFLFCQFSSDAVTLAALFCHDHVDSLRWKGLSLPFRCPFRTLQTNGKTVLWWKLLVWQTCSKLVRFFF